MEPKIKELIGIAASVAAGCDSCLQHHVRQARAEGAEPREIQTAITIARAVRLQAVTKIDDLAARLEKGDVIELVAVGAAGSDCDCGCGSDCKC